MLRGMTLGALVAVASMLAGSGPSSHAVRADEAEALRIADELRTAILKGDSEAVAKRIPPEGWTFADTPISRAELMKKLRPGGELYGTYFDTTRRRQHMQAVDEVLSYREWFAKYPAAKLTATRWGEDRFCVGFDNGKCATACPLFHIRKDAKGRWWLFQHPDEV